MPDHPEHVPYHFHHPMFVARVPVYVCGEGEVEVVAARHVPFPVLTTDLYSYYAVTCIGSNSVNGACKYLTKNLCLQPLITGSVNI